MEIRRKVYSLLQDENGEERYYSTNEFELSYDEETGEKMFSEKQKNSDNNSAASVGLAGAGVGGGLIVSKAGKKKITKDAKREIEKISDIANADLANQVELATKKKSAALDKAAQSREQWREKDLLDRWLGAGKEKKAKKEADKVIKEAERDLANQSSRIRQTADAAKKGVEEKAARRIARVSRHGKIIAGAGLTAAGGLLVADAAKNRKSSRS